MIMHREHKLRRATEDMCRSSRIRIRQALEKCLLCATFILSSLSVSGQIQQPSILSTGADDLPENYGGKQELKRLIEYHMIYPESALKKKTEGYIDIQYTCNEKGKIVSHKLMNHLDSALDAEAERLFHLLLWTPAFRRGEFIKYEYFIRIPFSISHYKKALKRRDKENANPDKLPVDTSTVICEKVSKQPVYIYGKDSLVHYVASELEYPQEAKNNNLEGVVTLSFIVEPNGFVSNIQVEKPVGGGCNEEAIRVMGQTKWYPARKDNVLVRSKMTYSIVFKLDTGYRDNVQGSQRLGGY